MQPSRSSTAWEPKVRVAQNQRARCRWVLDADIKSFFDEIDHDVILSRTPVFRRVIEGWLKAGVFTGEVFDSHGNGHAARRSDLTAAGQHRSARYGRPVPRMVAGRRQTGSCAKRWKHFPNRRKAIGNVKPENAVISLRGPAKPRKTSRSEPPKIYGPYPDGSWRTLRLVVNDKRTRTNPALRKDRKLRDLRLIRYADDFVVLARSRRQLETVVLPKLREFLAAGGFGSALRKQELCGSKCDSYPMGQPLCVIHYSRLCVGYW